MPLEHRLSQGISATGGVISDYTVSNTAIYRAHIFTSSGAFKCNCNF